MHFARRVPGREVELGEVIVVALDVRPFGDREAHVGEDGDDLVRHLADRMDAAGLDAGGRRGQGEVERLPLELGDERRPFQDAAARGQRLGHRILERVDRRAPGPALLGRELAEGREQGRHRALLAERGHAHGLERRLVGRARNGGQRLILQGVEVGHSGLGLGRRIPPPHARDAWRRRTMRSCAGASVRPPWAGDPSPARRSRRRPRARRWRVRTGPCGRPRSPPWRAPR